MSQNVKGSARPATAAEPDRQYLDDSESHQKDQMPAPSKRNLNDSLRSYASITRLFIHTRHLDLQAEPASCTEAAMTTYALVTGVLFRDSKQLTSKSGRVFVSATVRAKDGDAVQCGASPGSMTLARRPQGRPRRQIDLCPGRSQG